MSISPPAADPVLLQVVGDVLADPAAGVVPPDGGLAPLWHTARELDWPAVGVAEELGGVGGALADLCGIVRLVAAHPVSVPLPEAAVATWAAATAGVAASLAGAGLPTPVLPRAGESVHHHDGVISGDITRVAWACAADRWVVAAGDTVAVVDPTGAGVTTRPGANLAGEPRDTVRFDRAPVLATGPAPAGLGDRAGLLRVAAILGAVERAVALTVAHVGTRRQFGRPLAAFQAVGHGVATLAGEREQLRAALALAIASAQADESASPGPAADIAAARVVAGRAAGTVARVAHQLHGAIGITQEHDLHRYTTRLWAWRDEGGTERAWTRRLGAQIAGGGSAQLWQWLTAR